MELWTIEPPTPSTVAHRAMLLSRPASAAAPPGGGAAISYTSSARKRMWDSIRTSTKRRASRSRRAPYWTRRRLADDSAPRSGRASGSWRWRAPSTRGDPKALGIAAPAPARQTLFRRMPAQCTPVSSSWRTRRVSADRSHLGIPDRPAEASASCRNSYCRTSARTRCTYTTRSTTRRKLGRGPLAAVALRPVTALPAEHAPAGRSRAATPAFSRRCGTPCTLCAIIHS